jgi:hypothetical protein
MSINAVDEDGVSQGSVLSCLMFSCKGCQKIEYRVLLKVVQIF